MLLVAVGCATQDAVAPGGANLTLGYRLPAGTSGDPVGAGHLVSLLTEEGLVGIDLSGRHMRVLATDWGYSPERRTIEFTIKPGVTFHDGSALTPDLARNSLRLSVADPQDLFRYPMLGEIEAIETTPAGTLIIRLRRPTSLLADSLQVPIVKRTPNGARIGTGPYMLVGRSERAMILQAHPDYHGGQPYIERVELRPFASLRRAWVAMMRGEIDGLYEVPLESRDFVEDQTAVQVFAYARPFSHALIFNMHRPTFAASALRSALAASVDRLAIVRQVFTSRGRVADGIWPLHWAVTTPESRTLLEPTGNSLALPVSLTAAEGISGLEFTCLVNLRTATDERLATVLQRQLFQQGITMHLRAATPEEFVDPVRRRDYDAVLVEVYGGPGLEAHYMMWHSSFKSAPWHFGYDRADSVLDELRRARTNSEIRSALSQVQRVLHEDPPAVFIAWAETARVVSRRFEVPYEPGEDVIRSLWRWRPVTDTGLTHAADR